MLFYHGYIMAMANKMEVSDYLCSLEVSLQNYDEASPNRRKKFCALPQQRHINAHLLYLNIQYINLE